MNVIEKIILFIKNIFTKKEEVKKLEEPTVIVEEDKRNEFIDNLKVTAIGKKENKKIETLICAGDGLGIQKGIKY